MAILSSDVKLLESERLTDTDDGGGRATGREIRSAEINAVFPPVDRIDQAFGNFSGRKIYGGPLTDNADVYHGAHSAIIEDAKDPLINLLMVDTKSDADTLRDMKNYVESYQSKGARKEYRLWGDHLQFSQTVTLFAPVAERAPKTSDVLFLIHPSTGFEQAVRVQSLTDEVRDMTEMLGSSPVTYQVRRIQIQITGQLESNFPGAQPDYFWNNQRGTVIFDAVANSGIKYFGVKKLARAVAAGVSTVNVGNPFLPLAPTGRVSQSYPDRKPFAGFGSYVRFGGRISESLNVSSLGNGVYRCVTLRSPADSIITIAGSVYRDTGSGECRLQSGTDNCDYVRVARDTGMIEFKLKSGSVNSISIDWQPSAQFTGDVLSAYIQITPQTQRNVYLFDTGSIAPTPGSVRVSFRVLGRWYEARDNGAGVLVGDATGRVDYLTGTVDISLSALPDLGSVVICHWSSQGSLHTQTVVNQAQSAEIEISHTTEAIIAPGSLRITWTSGSTEVSVTDRGNQLVDSGGTKHGVVYCNDKRIVLRTNSRPNPGSAMRVVYRENTRQQSIIESPTISANSVTFTLPEAPTPSGLSFSVKTEQRHDQISGGVIMSGVVTQINRIYYDDGQGKLFTISSPGSISNASSLVGAVDYAGRTVTLYVTGKYRSRKVRTVSSNTIYGSSYEKQEIYYEDAFETIPAQPLSVTYQKAPASGSPDKEEPVTVRTLKVRLLPSLWAPLMAGSLVLSWGGRTYIDRGSDIVRNIDSRTGAGEVVGTINPTDKTMDLAVWEPTGDMSITAVTYTGEMIAQNAVAFVTAAAPIARGGYTVRLRNRKNGELLTATADENGNLSASTAASSITGTVDVQSGFTVLLSSTDKPVAIPPSTVSYNLVSEVVVPLDKAVVGIDPVRLPPDCRVPIFRRGDLVLLSHTKLQDISNPTAGAQLDAGRTWLAFMQVIDAAGTAMKTNQYTIDLERGRVTLATPLQLVDEKDQPLQLPLKLKHRAEHMTPVADVQVNGDIKLLSPTFHEFPATETVVCSCPIHGDKWARYRNWFTQRTWDTNNPNWTDQAIGAPTNAKFDTLNYPPELKNRGAVNERWAIVFTSATAFQVIGKSLGVIAQGSTATDCAPVNPNTNTPYFVLRKNGWGSGWESGNVVRFNTDGAISPVWLIRVVQPGRLQSKSDSFVYQIRGDVV